MLHGSRGGESKSNFVISVDNRLRRVLASPLETPAVPRGVSGAVVASIGMSINRRKRWEKPGDSARPQSDTPPAAPPSGRLIPAAGRFPGGLTLGVGPNAIVRRSDRDRQGRAALPDVVVGGAASRSAPAARAP